MKSRFNIENDRDGGLSPPPVDMGNIACAGDGCREQGCAMSGAPPAGPAAWLIGVFLIAAVRRRRGAGA